MAEYHRARLSDPERRAEYRRISRARAFRRKYGITLEDFDRMKEAQGGLCAICGLVPVRAGREAFQVDHDHETGVVRGLLCITCNTMLGWVERLPVGAIGRYLKRSDL